MIGGHAAPLDLRDVRVAYPGMSTSRCSWCQLEKVEQARAARRLAGCAPACAALSMH